MSAPLPIGVNQIARLVSPPVRPVTVRSWRRRWRDFPAPIAVYGGVPVFDVAAVVAMLVRHGRVPEKKRRTKVDAAAVSAVC